MSDTITLVYLCVLIMFKASLHTYQRLTSGALLCFLVGFWLMKALHPLLEHHHAHEDHPACTAADRDRSEHHLHDERYAVDECSICEFLLSVQECTPRPAELVLRSQPEVKSSPAAVTGLYFSGEQAVTCLRGPPAC